MRESFNVPRSGFFSKYVEATEKKEREKFQHIVGTVDTAVDVCKISVCRENSLVILTRCIKVRIDLHRNSISLPQVPSHYREEVRLLDKIIFNLYYSLRGSKQFNDAQIMIDGMRATMATAEEFRQIIKTY